MTRSQPPPAVFSAGDRIAQPVYGQGWLEGELVHIDCVIEGERVSGLAMLADPDEDGYRRYYEFLPHRARKLPPHAPGLQDKAPSTSSTVIEGAVPEREQR